MAENFVNILREIRGKTLAPATDKNCIYGDIKWMYGVIQGYQQITPEERLKLENIEEEATKNDTDANLRNRATHTGTQSADTIVDGVTNAAFTNAEKVKLAVLDITKPPEHLHHMNEIALGDLDASRITESSDKQFVTSAQKDRISGSEQVANKGVPNGYAPLGPNGKINPSYIDSMNLIDIFTPVDFDEMLLLSSAKPGDIAYVQESQNTYMLIGLPSDNPLNWKIINLAAGVVSINGLNGVISMTSDDLPEGSVNKYFTEDRITDEVKDFIKAGTNVAVSYDSITNKLTIDADTYAKAEIDAKLEAQNDASEINYSGTSSGLVATKVQGAIDEVEKRLDIVETAISSVNIIRADKYLASKNIARLIYESGNLTKIRYNIDSDVDYEVLTYSGEDLVNVAHYINEELKGNTVLTYASDELISSIFIGV